MIFNNHLVGGDWNMNGLYFPCHIYIYMGCHPDLKLTVTP